MYNMIGARNKEKVKWAIWTKSKLKPSELQIIFSKEKRQPRVGKMISANVSEEPMFHH